jgi:hypothetical protein
MYFNLPDCDGLALDNELWFLAEDSACVLVALSAQEHTKEQKNASPFDHHLLKPVNLDIIKQVIS